MALRSDSLVCGLQWMLPQEEQRVIVLKTLGLLLPIHRTAGTRSLLPVPLVAPKRGELSTRQAPLSGICQPRSIMWKEPISIASKAVQLMQYTNSWTWEQWQPWLPARLSRATCDWLMLCAIGDCRKLVAMENPDARRETNRVNARRYYTRRKVRWPFAVPRPPSRRSVLCCADRLRNAEPTPRAARPAP